VLQEEKEALIATSNKPQFKGLVTQGFSIEEIAKNIIEATLLIAESNIAEAVFDGRELP